MTALVPALQAIVRDELAGVHTIELAVVTATYTNEGGSGDTNLAVDARLRGSALELQHVPVAIGRLGLSLSPRVGDLCVVAFVRGDLNAPVVVGFLYDEQTRPPDAGATEIVYVVPDDAADADRRVEIQLASGNKVTIQDKKVDIEMGQTTMTIEADGAITMEAGGDITLKAQGKIALQAQSDIDIEAGASLTAKAQTSLDLEGQLDAKLKGVTTTIAGMTSFSQS